MSERHRNECERDRDDDCGRDCGRGYEPSACKRRPDGKIERFFTGVESGVRPWLTFLITTIYNCALLYAFIEGKIQVSEYIAAVGPANMLILGFWFGERAAMRSMGYGYGGYGGMGGCALYQLSNMGGMGMNPYSGYGMSPYGGYGMRPNPYTSRYPSSYPPGAPTPARPTASPQSAGGDSEILKEGGL